MLPESPEGQKFGMQAFHGMPPSSNLTGLTCACVYRIAGIDKELGMQDLSGDLSGFIQIYVVRIPCEDRNSKSKTLAETCQVLLLSVKV